MNPAATGIASTVIAQVREVAVCAVGVAREAERDAAVRALGVRVSATDGRAEAVAVEVRGARGRGIAPTPVGPAVAGAEARGVGSTPLVRPVNEVRGFGMVLEAAVGVFMPGEVPAVVLGVDAVRVRPGVAGPREGRGGIGWACTTAAAARDSRRRAGPDTGGRVLVNVLLRLLRIGVLASLPGSTLLSCAVEDVDGVGWDESPLEALPDRERAGSGLTVAAPEARGWSSLGPAVGVTSEVRGAMREAGFVTVEGAAEVRVTVDMPVLAEATPRMGVFSTACLPSCAFLAASVAHFCMFFASLLKSSSSSSSSSLLPLLACWLFGGTASFSAPFLGDRDCEMEKELLPNSRDASPLSSMRLPPMMLELPMKLPVRFSSIVSSPAAFFTTFPISSPLRPFALPLLPGVLGLISATSSSGTILHLGLALYPTNLAGELLLVVLAMEADADEDLIRALARDTSKLSSMVTSAAVLAVAARKLASWLKSSS